MTSSLLSKRDVDFLLALAEIERYLTYKEIVNFHFAKISKMRQVEDELAEKKKIYTNFRKAKSRIEEKQRLTGRKYFLEDENSKTFKIHPEAVEKPKTCVILLELINALKDGTREVEGGRFEIVISAKYASVNGTDDWSASFVRERLDDACRSEYISFDKSRNQYAGEARLTSDLGLIIGIVKGYCESNKTGEKMKYTLKELLEKF